MGATGSDRSRPFGRPDVTGGPSRTSLEEAGLVGEDDRLGAVAESSFWSRRVTCVLTVVSLMKSSWPISALDSPLVMRPNTSISRVVRVSTARGGACRCWRVKCWMTRLVIAGESSASPPAMVRTAISCSGGSSLRTKPLAPAQRLWNVVVEIEGREDQDPRGSVGGQDPPGGLETVELGHADVHHDHVRMEAGRLRHGLGAVARLRHHFDVGFVREQQAEPGPDHGLVIHQEDAHGHASRPSSGSRAWRTNPPLLEGPPTCRRRRS